MPLNVRWADCGVAALAIGLAVALPASAATAAGPASAAGRPVDQAADRAADHAAFLAENDRAMERMMAGMEITPSGDVDRDFVRMMVPHHRGAIEMAMAQLRYGRNPQLRRLAQEIIATQQQEIALMQIAIGLPPSAAGNDATPSAASSAPAAHGEDPRRHDAAAAMPTLPHSHKEPR